MFQAFPKRFPTWLRMYFSIPVSFFPSGVASVVLLFREGVLRQDLSEHCENNRGEHKLIFRDLPNKSLTTVNMQQFRMIYHDSLRMNSINSNTFVNLWMVYSTSL